MNVSSQMYVDLIVSALMDESKKTSEPTIFSLPIIGTFSPSGISIDSISETVPISEFSFLVDDKTTVKPQYTTGDRLVIVPTNDGRQLVVIGRLA